MKTLIIVMFVLLMSGCAGTVKNMNIVLPENVIEAPEPGKSLIVFMRPSGFGFAIQSSVFEIKDNNAILAGIVAAKKKVAYQVEPGEHLFMVIGESADFMSAELQENMTYYALVTPRLGLWKARFSLKPVHSDELYSSEFNDWIESCEWVEISPESRSWAISNMNSIQSKQREYYKDWMEKDESDRPKILLKDGK
ncbi:MAG: hypothetical protein IME94_09685 [Proteobacteria bacterium]|nr:hypothetical protein [Pseudomonadota bacterium]